MKCTTRSLAIAGVAIILGMLLVGYYMTDELPNWPRPALPQSSDVSSDDVLLLQSDNILDYA